MTASRRMFARLAPKNWLLASPFARRLVVLFVLSSMLPALLLGLLTFRYVEHQLAAVTERHVQHLVKAAGFSLFDWLLRRDLETRDVIARLERGERAADALRMGLDIRVEPLDATRLGPEERAALRRGHSVFERVPGPANQLDQFTLSRLAQTVDGELLVTNLLGDPPSAHTVLPPSVAYCYVDADATPIDCSEPMPSPLRTALVAQDTAGHQAFGLRVGEREVNVRSWQIFLGAEFGLRDWRIVVWHDREDLLISVAAFSEMLRPVLLVAAISAVLLAMVAIRHHLAPFRLLTDAARRIGAHDLDVRVDVRSGDELEGLGQAFNDMAARIKRNFQFMTALGAIDRDALTSKEPATTVRALLRGLAELVAHDWACVWFHDGRADGMLLMTQDGRTLDQELTRIPGLSAGDRVLVLSAEGWTEVPFAARAACARGAGAVERVYAAPLAVGQQSAASVWLAPRPGHSLAPEEEATFRELAARLGVALVNFTAKEELYQEAHFDTLTGLPNRRLFKEMLDGAILRAPRDHYAVGLLFIDLDDFKYVNDSLGHVVGDKLLRSVGESLRHTIRETDLVARLGGDEFVIIVPDLPEDESLSIGNMTHIAEKVMAELRNPVMLDGQELLVRASIGGALYPRDGANADELLRCADAAMYLTKDTARGGFTFFSQELNARATRRLALQAELVRGIERDEFVLFYQPQVSTQDGTVRGCEALLRWQHPTRGLLGPAEFIGEAEATGLIADIGTSALRQAARQLAAWHGLGYTELAMSVNVAARQFDDPLLVPLVENILGDVGIPAAMFELEITESAACRRLDHTVDVMQRLAALGVRIALDDFGTGHSSLAYLQRMPLRTLKVDRSFVIEIGVSRRGESIVDAILALAKCLDLEVVAEGVETEPQREHLAERGCDLIQGWLYKPALPAAKFLEFVDERRALASEHRQFVERIGRDGAALPDGAVAEPLPAAPRLGPDAT
jgi:diguanylate cyclase (GGDEF)-like protein